MVYCILAGRHGNTLVPTYHYIPYGIDSRDISGRTTAVSHNAGSDNNVAAVLSFKQILLSWNGVAVYMRRSRWRPKDNGLSNEFPRDELRSKSNGFAFARLKPNLIVSTALLAGATPTLRTCI